MQPGTACVSPEKRVTEIDFRSGKLWTERPDESSSGGGWPWVGALLVAALFIVSAYLDQEDGNTWGSYASSGAGAAASYKSNRPAERASLASTFAADRGTEKGY